MNKTLNKTIKTVAVAIALALGTVGCGGGGDDSGGNDTSERTTEAADAAAINITTKEFSFDPSKIDAAADREFTVKLTNAGVLEHDFTIVGRESAKITVAVGKSATGSYTLSAGKYEFVCSIPGHKESGMTGTLTVK